MQRLLFSDAAREVAVDGSQFVYVIQDPSTGHVKIGRTKSVAKRFAQFKTAWSQPHEILLTIPAADSRGYESALHRMWSPYRLEGEWFSFPEIMQHWVAHMRSGGNLDSWRTHVANIPRHRRSVA